MRLKVKPQRIAWEHISILVFFLPSGADRSGFVFCFLHMKVFAHDKVEPSEWAPTAARFVFFFNHGFGRKTFDGRASDAIMSCFIIPYVSRATKARDTSSLCWIGGLAVDSLCFLFRSDYLVYFYHDGGNRMGSPSLDWTSVRIVFLGAGRIAIAHVLRAENHTPSHCRLGQASSHSYFAFHHSGIKGS